jgi:hypothetical protein
VTAAPSKPALPPWRRPVRLISEAGRAMMLRQALADAGESGLGIDEVLPSWLSKDARKRGGKVLAALFATGAAVEVEGRVYSISNQPRRRRR